MRHNQSGDSTAVWVLVLGLIGLYLLYGGGFVSWSEPPAYQYRNDCCHYRYTHDGSDEVYRHR